MTLRLQQLDHLPDGLLDLPASRLHEQLDGPTLIHLPGRREPALFVSVLLHGNEDTGWEAVRSLLARYASQALPRALSLLIGNVAAARHGLRRLDSQPDYNRVWRGGDSPEHAVMAEVVASMRQRGLFASVDVHNNTGLNPHYGCVNRLDPPTLHLATLFSRTVVYFLTPDSVQSRAFSDLCPAVTIECGQPGGEYGTHHVIDYLDACLHLAALPEHPVPPHDLDLFHTLAVVRLPEDATLSFDGTEATLRFVPELDHLNFRELAPGTVLADCTATAPPLLAVSEAGRDLTERYFGIDQGRLVTRIPLMPSMLTLNERIIRQDCLCYIMERMELPQ